jgi:hypothetical protein
MKAIAGILLLLLLPACDDDPSRPPPENPGSMFEPLTSRDAVVNNLELAWTQQRLDKLDDLLDADFVFYLDLGDVGGEIPPQWDRATEVAVTSGLFDSDHAQYPTGPVCNEVRVDLANDELIWTEVPVPVTAIAEVWYRTTVPYTFMFKMAGDITYINNDASAELTVRQVENEWRLVEWRDLGANRMNTRSASEESTWGLIKSLYR